MHVSVTILQRKSGSCPTIKHKKKKFICKAQATRRSYDNRRGGGKADDLALFLPLS